MTLREAESAPDDARIRSADIPVDIPVRNKGPTGYFGKLEDDWTAADVNVRAPIVIAIAEAALPARAPRDECFVVSKCM